MLIFIYIIYIYIGLNKNRGSLDWIIKKLFNGDAFLIVM